MAGELSALKGVGAKVSEKLQRLGIETLDDLLFHLPSRYLDRSHVTPIGAVALEQDVVLEGHIELADVAFGKRRSLICRISDGTGSISLRFFYFNAAQQRMMERGRAIRVFGEVRLGSSGFEIYHPEYLLGQPDLPPLTPTLTPVYPLTEGITQRQLRDWVRQALAITREHPPRDLLPSAGHFSLIDALQCLHEPPINTPFDQLVSGEHPALQRLVLEELVAHQLAMLHQRQTQQQIPAFACTRHILFDQLRARLPFALTGAQQRVIHDILADMAQPKPMLRLLQGDVGSGKTLVGAAAACAAMGSGCQVALMAPTEILAKQHFNSFSQWFEPFGITPGWLAGSCTARQRREVLAQLAAGEVSLVIGTHALFQEDVSFARLGLVIIDEQHRFGVQQRLALLSKAPDGMQPHQLVMTATPIPRTLAMSLYGDLDTSVIDELPPGRQPIDTRVLDASRELELIARLDGLLADGAQAYWVCTLIEESELLQAQAAEKRHATLVQQLPDVCIALVHGRMTPAEKEATMQQFKAGDIQLLVATTVIEVGVDVPNASCMVIENAERLGLSQLHQLRGRVGRGSRKSVCLLLYQPPLGETAQRRLSAMRNSSDGFYLAEEDLRLRGPGEWLGTRQAGELVFRVADLVRDEALMNRAKALARQLHEDQPDIANELIARWFRHANVYAGV